VKPVLLARAGFEPMEAIVAAASGAAEPRSRT
jgi:hypothetical protein